MAFDSSALPGCCCGLRSNNAGSQAMDEIGVSSGKLGVISASCRKTNQFENLEFLLRPINSLLNRERFD